MPSRDPNSLKERTRERLQHLQHLLTQRGLDVLFYCMHRSEEEQARLFRNGRSLQEIEHKALELRKVYHRPDLAELLMDVGPQYGRHIVTWAGPGQSMHNYGYAIDGVPMRDGKPVWRTLDDPGTEDVNEASLWVGYGELAQLAGFDWAGEWSPAKREYPHIQEPGVHWKDLIHNG